MTAFNIDGRLHETPVVFTLWLSLRIGKPMFSSVHQQRTKRSKRGMLIDVLCSIGIVVAFPTSRQSLCLLRQVMLAVKRGRHNGGLLCYAAARATLWVLLDMPAYMETLLFPHHIRTAVRAVLLQDNTWPWQKLVIVRRLRSHDI